MLSLMIEVDHCVASIVCFVWDAKPVLPTPCMSLSLLSKMRQGSNEFCCPLQQNLNPKKKKKKKKKEMK